MHRYTDRQFAEWLLDSHLWGEFLECLWCGEKFHELPGKEKISLCPENPEVKEFLEENAVIDMDSMLRQLQERWGFTALMSSTFRYGAQGERIQLWVCTDSTEEFGTGREFYGNSPLGAVTRAYRKKIAPDNCIIYAENGVE